MIIYMETWEWLAGVMRELGSLLSPAACVHSFQSAMPARPCKWALWGMATHSLAWVSRFW